MSRAAVAFGALVLVASGIMVAGKLTQSPPSDVLAGLKRHGGDVTATTRHLFEVALVASGVRIYPYDAQGTPLRSTALSGKARLERGGSAAVERALVAVTEAPRDGFSDHLEAALELKGAGPARIEVEIAGFDDAAEASTHFTIALGGP